MNMHIYTRIKNKSETKHQSLNIESNQINLITDHDVLRLQFWLHLNKRGSTNVVTCPGQRTSSGAGLALLGDSISLVFLLQVPSLWASRNSLVSAPHLHSERLGLPACVLWPGCSTVLGMPTACAQQVLLPHGAISPALDYHVSDFPLLCPQCLCVNVGVCTPWQRSEDNLRDQVSPSTSMEVHVVRRTRQCCYLISLALQYLSTAMQSKLWLHSGLLMKLALHCSTSCVFQNDDCIVRESKKIAIKKTRIKFKMKILNLKY